MAGSAVRIAILANGKRAREEFASVGAAGGRLGASLKRGLLAGTVALGGLAVAAKSAVDSAAELGDSIGANGVIFGKASKEIVAFSRTTAKALGLSQQGALDAAADFGTFGKAAGLTGKPLANFSKKMISLSGDLASFRGGTAAEAVTAIGAAMRGETEPIRRYGVLLDDASLRQEALAEGLVKTTKTALTPQQKTLAAYNLILKQTTDAQGDFARTSGSAKNQAQAQAAAFADLKARIGTGLLPAYSALLTAGLKLTDWFSQTALPAISVFTRGIRDALGPPLSALAGELRTKVVPKIRGALSGIRLPSLDIGKSASDIRKAAEAYVKPLREGLARGIQNDDWGPLGSAIAQKLKDAISGLSAIAGSIGGAVRDAVAGVNWADVGKEAGRTAIPFSIGFAATLLDPLLDPKFWRDNWETVLVAVASFIPIGRGASLIGRAAEKIGLADGLVGGLIRTLEKPLGKLRDAIGSLLKGAGAAFKEGFQRIFPAADEATAAMGRLVATLKESARTKFAEFSSAVKEQIFLPFQQLGEGAGLIASKMAEMAGVAVRSLASGIGSLADLVTAPVRALGARIVAGLGDLSGRLRAVAGTAVSGIGRRISELAGGAGSAVASLAGRIVRGLGDLAGRFRAKASGAIGALRAQFSGVAKGALGWLYSAGTNIVAGAVNGVRDSAGALLNEVRSLGRRASDAFRNILDINSPSRVFRQIAVSIPEGAAAGVRDGAHHVTRAITGLATAAKGALVGRLFGVGLGAGILGQEARVRKAAQRLMSGTTKGADVTVLRSATAKALTQIDRQVKAMNAFAAKQRAALASLIKSRNDYAAQVAEGLRGGGLTSISLEDAGPNPTAGRSTLVAGLQARLAAIKAFQFDMAALAKRGLSTNILQQIADSGLETGAAYLASLRGATPALIQQINGLNGAINAASGSTGASIANSLFGARISAATRAVAAAPTVIRIESSGSALDDLLVQILRRAIRVRGGNAQIVLGR